MSEFRPGPETRVRPRGDVLFRDLGGEAVLLDPEAGTYFGLNEVGTEIWSLLAEGTPLGEAHVRLVRTYDAPADEVWEDLVALVRDLVGSRLVEVLDD
ncbi:MAG TPA: PqqD family protein [Thermoanaerobaculia bacterium]|nr:PqqD family protein [Thermoanaerobaculia bacterium]